MPFTKNLDIRIYYEVVGQGPPIILAHGATGNTTFWAGYGYVDRLKNNYTVITFDARGHGQSDKPHVVESYDYQLMVGDVIAVMNELGIAKTHYWGYSMGGYIGFGIAKHSPDRLTALIVGGSTPYGSQSSTRPSPLLSIFERGVQDGVDAAIEGMKIKNNFLQILHSPSEILFRSLIGDFDMPPTCQGLQKQVASSFVPCPLETTTWAPLEF